MPLAPLAMPACVAHGICGRRFVVTRILAALHGRCAPVSRLQMVLVTEAVTGCLREALLGLTASSSHTSSTQHQHQHQHQHHSQRNQQHQHGYHGLAQGGSPHAAAAASSAAGFGAGSRGAGHGDGRGTGATEAGGGGGTAVGPLEAKLGVLALAEVLTFLHGTARMAHCGLSPQVGAAERWCGVEAVEGDEGAGWRRRGSPRGAGFVEWAGALSRPESCQVVTQPLPLRRVQRGVLSSTS